MTNNNESSGMSLVVGLVAIIAIIAMAWFGMQLLNQQAADGGSIDVNLEGDLPTGESNQ